MLNLNLYLKLHHLRGKSSSVFFLYHIFLLFSLLSRLTFDIDPLWERENELLCSNIFSSYLSFCVYLALKLRLNVSTTFFYVFRFILLFFYYRLFYLLSFDFSVRLFVPSHNSSYHEFCFLRSNVRNISLIVTLKAARIFLTFV